MRWTKAGLTVWIEEYGNYFIRLGRDDEGVWTYRAYQIVCDTSLEPIGSGETLVRAKRLVTEYDSALSGLLDSEEAAA